MQTAPPIPAPSGSRTAAPSVHPMGPEADAVLFGPTRRPAEPVTAGMFPPAPDEIGGLAFKVDLLRDLAQLPFASRAVHDQLDEATIALHEASIRRAAAQPGPYGG